MKPLLCGRRRPLWGVAPRPLSTLVAALAAVAVFTALAVTVSACGMATESGPAASAPDTAGLPTLPEEMPADFGFVAAWGVGAKNSIDTFAGTVVKDRVTEPSASGVLVLSAEAMQSLYQDLRTMENTWQMFSAGLNLDPNPFSEIYPTGATVFVTPHMTYRLDWSGGGFEAVYADWDDSMLSPEPRAVALREWFRKLREMVEAAPEWQALPAAVGGYM